ncbi:MAG: ribosome maturation factor RimM [Terriglobia bacterium]
MPALDRRFAAIARIARPQGRRGEVSAEITTDFPGRFQNLTRVFLSDLDDSGAVGVSGGSDARGGALRPDQPVRIERAWAHKGRIVLKFSGVDSIDQAERLRGLAVMIPREERVALPDGAYYTGDLEGCRVMMGSPEALQEVGTVTSVEPTGGVPVLHVSRAAFGRSEALIPFARAICREIDPEAKRIVIDPPEDLLELNDEE